MKAAAIILLALVAVASAGPAFNKNNQIDTQADYYGKQQQQQSTYMTGVEAKGPAADLLKQWCYSSQMSQQELTASFKKLVNTVKSNPLDQTIEQAVMGERICAGTTTTTTTTTGQKTTTTGTGTTTTNTIGQQQVDAQAHELIKDVYMDALISCKSHECTQQLVKIINSNKVDTIRASYYMTRIAVTEKDDIKDESEIKQLADSFINQPHGHSASEATERQKLFAITSLIGKWIQSKPQDSSVKPIAEQVAKTIVERYIKPVSSQEAQQYQQQQPTEQVSQQLAKKIAKRSAALKALANIPGHMLKQFAGVEEELVELAQNKQELVTVRQSAIEALEQNDKALNMLKQLTFDQEEPIEVRVAAYRALMTTAYAAGEQAKQQGSGAIATATEIVDQIVKHCEEPRNQQQDDQFVLYAISHLDNVRTSQQPEHQAIKESISKNKQHYMQIQVLNKKFKQQLADVRRSSRNYKLEQEFNQLESGLVLEGDLVYESKNSNKQQQQQQAQILPKLIRVNMSMPVMGETVGLVEITLRQNQMDEEVLSALKLVQNTKFTSQTMSKVVDSFKQSAQQQQQQQQQHYSTGSGQAEADLTIKVDGCTVVYVSIDDFKASAAGHQRNTRSVYASSSIVADIVEYLKRKPIAFNRGLNFNINERLAKVLDVEANLIAGLRFESRANGRSANDFEIVARMEPRFAFESIVGPAKVSSKKLLQRVSAKSAMGIRLRFKKDELVDVQVELPSNTVAGFNVESQLVEKKSNSLQGSYNYLPESIYGDEDIYSSAADYAAYHSYLEGAANKLVKRSTGGIFGADKAAKLGAIGKLYKGKSVAASVEIPETIARALGLHAKVRLAASPKDMYMIMSGLVEKYEPGMQGYRMQVQKVERGPGQKDYQVAFSTPGSRKERSMQVRVSQLSNSQRTIVKADVQSAKMSASGLVELVHDGRQYSIKSEFVSRSSSSGRQQRHLAELGLMRSSQSPAGRLAITYKPYLSIESSSLKRPIQLQGTISYQQSPKSVIIYELKCQTSGDYVQGKLIVDQRDSQQTAAAFGAMRKRSSAVAMSARRSMQSPVELMLQKDLTLSNEIIGQIQQHAVKVHNMLDWDSSKWALQAAYSGSYKNMRKQPSQESQLQASVKFDAEQQVFTVERKSPQEERKQFRAVVSSQVRPTGHQLVAELHYNGRRESLVAYKHKIDYQKISTSKFELGMQVELIDTERKLDEKIAGRARATMERKLKAVQAELSGGEIVAKMGGEWHSFEQHQMKVELETGRFEHKAEWANSPRQFVYSWSRASKHGQLVGKALVEVRKQQPAECQLLVEMPAKRVHVAADIKLGSGRQSSIAVQTPRFASSAEFAFETFSRSFADYSPMVVKSILGAKRATSGAPGSFFAPNLRIKSNLKDLAKKQAYWMDSALNIADWNKETSYLRMDSPVYRADLEFNPRESATKWGAYARSAPASNNFDAIYSSSSPSSPSAISAIVDAVSDKIGQQLLTPGKLWMLRSIVAAPGGMENAKQQARSALFAFANRDYQSKHKFNWNPISKRVTLDLEHAANVDFNASPSWQPIRMSADLGSIYSSRPSTVSLKSDIMDFELDAKPIGETDGETYARVSALSRHRRSPFKSHQSEWRYNKKAGHKAFVKHTDAKGKRHELRMEADKSPATWTRMAYDSDKHGKANWEHKWAKHGQKRAFDNEEVYANSIAYNYQSPSGKWAHQSDLQWEVPRSYYAAIRAKRDIFSSSSGADSYRSYAPLEYLKHTSGRLASKARLGAPASEYNVDFDYQPELSGAHLEVRMPEDMLHSSSVQFKPSERLYKLKSKLYNSISGQPSYEFALASKGAEQTPVFVNSEHEMFERLASSSPLASLFGQPMKLDYSDKFGRLASLDYDYSPAPSAVYAGLRQKRAALRFKGAEVEHSLDYDFYPETLFGRMKPAYKRAPGEMSLKASTKFGPVMVRADSTSSTLDVELVSPLMAGKLTSESSARAATTKLIKFYLDNKSQRVQLAKLVRDYLPVLRNSPAAIKLARKFDSSRFEQKGELLVNLVQSIIKLKAESKLNERPVLFVEAELNKQQEKLYAKVNGERANGQLVVDLMQKSADLVLELDDERTLKHVTRLARSGDKFYTLESMTSHKSRPVFKLAGKVSSMIFDPSHVFARRRLADDSHVSTFEAIVYEPKQYHISAEYDCMKKEARIVTKNVEEQKVQETIVKFDEQNETIYALGRLSTPYATMYATNAKISLPGLFDSYKCHSSSSSTYGANQSCSTEMTYSDKFGNWAAKYEPDEYVSISTPYGKQRFAFGY